MCVGGACGAYNGYFQKYAEEQYTEFYEKYKSRIRASYEAGETSYIQVLLKSANFSELLTRIDFVTDMIEYDKYLAR